MNKLVTIVPFYKRHRLTSLCFDRLRDQSKRLGFDIIVAGSEGEESKKIAKGIKYIEVDNNPLGGKLNTLMKECTGYDGVIIIGSDDFMSDSIIEMYQKIDVSKQVYYSFNDIYIYSSKHKILASDFQYTRNGNGIGVARLYTKPTLEKMNYEVWSNDKLKGLDGNADQRLRAKGIKEIRLDLKGHFLLDAKVEQNISAQEIVFTGHKRHDLKLIETLGDVGKKLLKLDRTEPERVARAGSVDKISARVVKEFNGHKKGVIIELKKRNYKDLLKAGYINHVDV